MAKKELLLFLVLNSLLQLATIGSACGKSNKGEWLRKEENMIWAQDLAGRSKKITMSSIMDKYKELMKMQDKESMRGNVNMPDNAELDNDIYNSVALKVFVSSSLGKNLLKDYVQQARKYGATLVFNGLPDNSWQSLAELVTTISDEGDEVSMQIDPEEFDRFDIKSVPAFVLSKEDNWFTNGDDKQPVGLKNNKIIYDKVDGNIGIRSALRLFAENGELATEARIRLEDNK